MAFGGFASQVGLRGLSYEGVLEILLEAFGKGADLFAKACAVGLVGVIGEEVVLDGLRHGVEVGHQLSEELIAAVLDFLVDEVDGGGGGVDVVEVVDAVLAEVELGAIGSHNRLHLSPLLEV